MRASKDKAFASFSHPTKAVGSGIISFVHREQSKKERIWMQMEDQANNGDFYKAL